MANWDDRLFNSKIWASEGALEEPTSAQAAQGLEFLGDEKPSFGLHNAMFQYIDRQRDWLFRQVKAVATAANVPLTPNNFNVILAGIRFFVNEEARSRVTADETEALNRSKADAELLRLINQIALDRSGGDNTLYGEIDRRIGIEGTARINADNNLKSYIDSVDAERNRIDNDVYTRINTRFITAFAGGTNGEFVAPPGCYRFRTILTAGGGAGAGSGDDGQGGFISGGAGGAGGTSIGVFGTFPGQRWLVNVGLGGINQGPRSVGQSGATSYFSRINDALTGWIQVLAATGGEGAGWANSTTSMGGAPGRGFGGLELWGGYGGEGQAGAYRGIGGMGGASYWGGGGKNAPGGISAQAYGAGGGGSFGSFAGGGNGQAGICVIEGF